MNSVSEKGEGGYMCESKGCKGGATCRPFTAGHNDGSVDRESYIDRVNPELSGI
jgi:hypothetical protein